jgi:hypothetical protein
MTKRVVSGEEKLFPVVLALLGILIGAYTLLGKDILESEGETLSSVGDTLFLALSLAATGAGLGALVMIAIGRAGAWWVAASWLACAAWFGLTHVLA